MLRWATSLPADVYDMPMLGGRVDSKELAKLIEHPYSSHAHIFIEKAQSMPRQGIASAFNYGVTYGIIIGIVAAHDIAYTEVAPSKWKRAMGLNDDKEHSRAEACRIFPEMRDHLNRKKDHNRAEALLLAEYGRRELVRLGVRIEEIKTGTE